MDNKLWIKLDNIDQRFQGLTFNERVLFALVKWGAKFGITNKTAITLTGLHRTTIAALKDTLIDHRFINVENKRMFPANITTFGKGFIKLYLPKQISLRSAAVYSLAYSWATMPAKTFTCSYIGKVLTISDETVRQELNNLTQLGMIVEHKAGSRFMLQLPPLSHQLDYFMNNAQLDTIEEMDDDSETTIEANSEYLQMVQDHLFDNDRVMTAKEHFDLYGNRKGTTYDE